MCQFVLRLNLQYIHNVSTCDNMLTHFLNKDSKIALRDRVMQSNRASLLILAGLLSNHCSCHQPCKQESWGLPQYATRDRFSKTERTTTEEPWANFLHTVSLIHTLNYCYLTSEGNRKCTELIPPCKKISFPVDCRNTRVIVCNGNSITKKLIVAQMVVFE